MTSSRGPRRIISTPSAGTRHIGASANRRADSGHSGGGHRPPAPKRSGSGKGIGRRIVLWSLGALATLVVLGACAIAYLYVTTDIPQPERIAMAQKTTVYYADGKTPIGTYADQNREIIDCSSLPDYVGNAVVASENRTFWKDRGLDLRGIGRAFLNNLTRGTRQGGSTITQQYAERYYLGETTSYPGKLREAILAVKIARDEDKHTVLCNYLNTIYLGRGAYGIQAAAQTYFHKDAKKLTLPEAAMLAGIIPSPSGWDPAVNASQAKARFTRVLKIMEEDGYISAAERRDATMPKPRDTSKQNVYAGTNGYLLMMVRKELTDSKAFSGDDLDTGGYRIVTTIDKAKQDLLFSVASPSQPGNALPEGVQVGAISVNPKNGSIISVYCGDDYLKHQLNNATQATYQVGSTMKPFTLMGAIQDGVSLNTTFNGNSPRGPFDGRMVSNFGNVSYGYVTLYRALANSVNTVFMDLNTHVTAKRTAQVAHAAGVTGKIRTNLLNNVLGTDALSVLDITRGYATIANSGSKPTLHIVSRVQESDGRSLYKAPSGSTRVFDTNNDALLTQALTGPVQYGSGAAAKGVGKTLAGKTGTANDNSAVSFVGFTPSTLTTFAIWNPGSDGKAHKVPTLQGYADGVGYPVHLFTRYMTPALTDVKSEAFPTAVDKGRIGGPDGSWGVGGVRPYTYSPQPYTSTPSQTSNPTVTPNQIPTPTPSASTPSASEQPTTQQPTTTPQSTPGETGRQNAERQNTGSSSATSTPSQ